MNTTIIPQTPVTFLLAAWMLAIYLVNSPITELAYIFAHYMQELSLEPI